MSDEELRALILSRTQRASNGCLVWTGWQNNKGYGSLAIKRVTKLAHRVAYEAFVGPIPDGYQIDHLCRIRNCVEPSHLEAVTPTVNNARSTSPSSINAAKDACVHGHEFTPENTYVPPKRGGRYCRECKRADNRRRGRGPMSPEQRERKIQRQRDLRRATLDGEST